MMSMDLIQGFKGEYFFLSNFQACNVIYQGLRFTSVEAAFQSAKTLETVERKPFQELTPQRARATGRRLRLRPDWETVKDDVMRSLLRIKFRENPELRVKLLATGDAILVESNTWHDNYWGSCTCPRCQGRLGKNRLGELLMETRQEFRSGTGPVLMFMDLRIPRDHLFPQEYVLKELGENGGRYQDLAKMAGHYSEHIGTELMWRYPSCEGGAHTGAFLLMVQEGFLYLPFQEVWDDTYEQLLLDQARLLTAAEAAKLRERFRPYADDLLASLDAMEGLLSRVVYTDQAGNLYFVHKLAGWSSWGCRLLSPLDHRTARFIPGLPTAITAVGAQGVLDEYAKKKGLRPYDGPDPEGTL